jgi:hypothetical protein
LGWPPAQRASGSERGGHPGPFPPTLILPLGGGKKLFFDSIGCNIDYTLLFYHTAFQVEIVHNMSN